MKRSKIQIFFSYLLLLYFFGFVVPPVSAIFPSGYLNVFTDGQFVTDTRSNQKDLMLIDLVLWEMLNKTKRKDDLLQKLTSTQNDFPRISDAEDYSIASVPDGVPPGREFSRGRSKNVFYYQSNPRFTHSGPSPPATA